MSKQSSVRVSTHQAGLYPIRGRHLQGRGHRGKVDDMTEATSGSEKQEKRKLLLPGSSIHVTRKNTVTAVYALTAANRIDCKCVQ